MKKILLPLFGGILLTGSLGLTTGQNVNTTIKNEEKERKTQELFNQGYSINSARGLNEEQITTFRTTSQNWNESIIDKTLNQALEYRNGQLVINQKKLDKTKLPLQLLDNIDLALANINNAVTAGFIKVTITTNNIVELVYPNNDTLKNSNDGIVYFNEGTSISSYGGSYMWYSTYGPSRWWKFWEWGGYLHFSDQAVQNAKWINLIVSVIILDFLFKYANQILDTVNNLDNALKTEDTNKINTLKKKLSELLGGIDINALGEITKVLLMLRQAVTFIKAVAGFASILLGLITIIKKIILSITNQMLDANRGNGVKWQWQNFVIPGWIIPE